MISSKDFHEKQILFVLLEAGEKISFKNDNIVIQNGDGTIKHQSTCYLLFALFIAGHLNLTSGLMQRAKRFGFSIVLMTYTMRVYAVLSSLTEGNVLLRKRQYAYDSLEIGARIISNKIQNQQAALKKIREKSEQVKTAVVRLGELKDAVLVPGLSVQEIMGTEGAASKAYFSAIFEGHNWKSRKPRVKHDMANCLLDIGYSLLFNIIDGLISLYGFDAYVGVLHRQFYQRKSLVCDLVEPFRPIIDTALSKALNLGQCNVADFSLVQGQYMIVGKKAAPYIQLFIKSLLEYRDEIFLYIQSYYRAFMRGKPVGEFPFFNLEKD